MWLGLFAVYAATLAVDVPGHSEIEQRHLAIAESLVADREFGDRPGAQGVGFGLLIAPAQAVGGTTGVELFLAALAALGFAFAAALAGRLVPEPWATRGVLLVALSPPALAYATTVLPEMAAAALLAGAALSALRVREDPRVRHAVRAAALLAILLWLGPKFAIVATPVFVALIAWARKRGRRLVALVSGEIVFGSLVAYVTANDVLFGGVTPYAAGHMVTGVDSIAGYAERLPRLVTLWVDPEEGALRWAPVLALAFVGAFLLWRSRRERLARVVSEHAQAEITAALALVTAGIALVVAAFGAPRLEGPWPPARHLVVVLPLLAPLVAWGLRRLPRTGAALGAATLGLSIWHTAAGLW